MTSGRAELPSDWGKFAKLPSFQDFEDGGVLIPPKQKMAFFIHTPYPEDQWAENALAIRGPYTKGFVQGDVTDQDEFLKMRTGPCTRHAVSACISRMRLWRGEMIGVSKQTSLAGPVDALIVQTL